MEQQIKQNQLAPTAEEERPMARFNKTIMSVKTKEYLQQVLGNKASSFVNNITAIVANDKKLQECTPMSCIYAGIKATALDLPLDPNLGFAYVIPFRNSKEGKTEAQFQIGYRGFIQLAMRTGLFRTINVREVKEGEIVDEDFISGELKFKKLPDDIRPAAKTVGFVAFFRLLNGFEKMNYMSVQEVEQHAKRYSQTYSSNKDYIRSASKWTTDFDAMAKKTVLKLLLSKYAPLSVEMQNAINNDQLVFSENGSSDYADNPEDQTNIADGEARKEELRQKQIEAESFSQLPDEERIEKPDLL